MNTLITSMNRDAYMASIDPRPTYYFVKIAEEQRRFLCFKWQGNIYQFTFLPSGVAEGPMSVHQIN